MTNFYENTKELLINDFIVDLDFSEEDAVERVNDMYEQIKYELVELIENLLETRKEPQYGSDYIEGMKEVLELVKGSIDED